MKKQNWVVFGLGLVLASMLSPRRAHADDYSLNQNGSGGYGLYGGGGAWDPYINSMGSILNNVTTMQIQDSASAYSVTVAGQSDPVQAVGGLPANSYQLMGVDTSASASATMVPICTREPEGNPSEILTASWAVPGTGGFCVNFQYSSIQTVSVDCFINGVNHHSAASEVVGSRTEQHCAIAQ